MMLMKYGEHHRIRYQTLTMHLSRGPALTKTLCRENAGCLTSRIQKTKLPPARQYAD